MSNPNMDINSGSNGQKLEAMEIGVEESTVRRGNRRPRENSVNRRAPCGACKFMRRKCTDACMYAPYFSSDSVGENRFRTVHKVFGTSNFSKLLLHIPSDKRQDAVESICFEAEERFSDLVYGCLLKVTSMEQQLLQEVHELRTETQLLKRRLNDQLRRQQQRQQMGIPEAGVLSAYSSNSADKLSDQQRLQMGILQAGLPSAFVRNSANKLSDQHRQQMGIPQAGLPSAFARINSANCSMNSLRNMGSLSNSANCSMNSLGNMGSFLLMSNMGSTSYGSSRMTDETQLHPHHFDPMTYENRSSMLTSRPVEHLQRMASSSPSEQSHYPLKLQNSVHGGHPLNYSIPHK